MESHDPLAGRPIRAGAVLSGDQIRQALAASPPLLEDLPDPDRQVQPNGVDLTLRAVDRLVGPGAIALEDAGRVLPEAEPVEPDGDGWWELAPGAYRIRFNEVVNLPLDLMALGRPRSSLARSGVLVHTAVWDAGYSGRSTALLVVANPWGFRVQRDARVAQLVFLGLASASSAGYAGAYQGENVGPTGGDG